MSLRLGIMIALADVVKRLENASEMDYDVDTVLAQVSRHRMSLARLGERNVCKRAAEIVLEELQEALDMEDVSPAVMRRMTSVVRRLLGAAGAKAPNRRGARENE